MTERTGIALGDSRVHDLRQQAEDAARERLGRDRWACARSAGRQMSIDAMLNDIDDALRRRVPADAERRNESHVSMANVAAARGISNPARAGSSPLYRLP